MQSQVHHRPGCYDSSLDMVPRPHSRHHSRSHYGSRHGGATPFGSFLVKSAKAAWKNRDKIAPIIDIAHQIGVPDKYLKYGRVAAAVANAIPKGSTRPSGSGAPRARRRPSRYNLLVSSVVKDKFAGQPDALAKASAYIKEHNLFHGGHYVPGSTGATVKGGMRHHRGRRMY